MGAAGLGVCLSAFGCIYIKSGGLCGGVGVFTCALKCNRWQTITNNFVLVTLKGLFTNSNGQILRSVP